MVIKSMDDEKKQLKQIIEAAIFIADGPLSIAKMMKLFVEDTQPPIEEIREALEEIKASMQDRGIELVEVASGFRFQAKLELSEWLQRFNERKPPRYSRALLETLALIAYQQPISRGDIESIRGVAVNSQIIRTLLDRDWIKIVGQRDVPGKPELFGTTKTFLDYFNFKNLSDLPPLPQFADLEQIEPDQQPNEKLIEA